MVYFRYKTEMCRPFMEHGSCKYGDKCQFAHGTDELRSVNRHPKYKTDMCRTYHSVGFCPYGPRCHFIHALDEIRPQPAAAAVEKKSGGAVKQLPMFGGGSSTWSFPDTREARPPTSIPLCPPLYLSVPTSLPLCSTLSHMSTFTPSFPI